MRQINLGRPLIKSLLVHGNYNGGKTHLLGSLLSHEKQYGKCVYVNVQGEEMGSLLAFDLTDVELYQIESVLEVPGLVRDIGTVHAIVLDSVQRLGEIAGEKVTGGSRSVGDKDDHGKEWNRLKFEVFKVLELFKRASTLFAAVCPSGYHENQITKTTKIIPRLPGVGEDLVGRFNFVGYMEATTLSTTRTDRTIDFQTRTDATTRCNAPTQPSKKLAIPDGVDAWVPIKRGLEYALRGGKIE